MVHKGCRNLTILEPIPVADSPTAPTYDSFPVMRVRDSYREIRVGLERMMIVNPVHFLLAVPLSPCAYIGQFHYSDCPL